MQEREMVYAFRQSCAVQYLKFSKYRQCKADLSLCVKPKFNLDFSAVVSNFESVHKILTSDNFMDANGALIGFRGNLVLMEDWQIYVKEKNDAKPKCSLCHFGLLKLETWIDHVNQLDCIAINPCYFIKDFDAYPMLNNMRPKTQHPNLPNINTRTNLLTN